MKCNSRINIKVSDDLKAQVADRVGARGNISQYIKRLITEDLAKHKGVTK